MTKKQYDIAISFLSQDEDLAVKLYAELSGSLRTFVYSKKQETVAGTDGTESFRDIFRNNSNLCVVLFRKGWGETKFTTVEEAAIKDFGSNNRWKGIIVIMLDSSTPPAWLPEGNIRINYSLYGFEQTVGAIKARAQEEGALVHKQSPKELAAVLRAQDEFAQKRAAILASATSIEEATQLVRILFSEIERHVGEIKAEVPALSIVVVSNNDQCVIRSSSGRARSTSITWNVRYGNSLNDSNLHIYECTGTILLHGEIGVTIGERSKEVNEEELQIDYSAHGWCWKTSDNKYLTSAQLAEKIMSQHLRLMRNTVQDG